MNDDDRHRRNHEEGIDERQDNRNHKDQQNKSLDMAKTCNRLEVPESLEASGAKGAKDKRKKMNIMTQNTTNIKMIVI